ncbi:MAG: hypothetical protein WBX19_01880 [Terracidiphilus sp.]
MKKREFAILGIGLAGTLALISAQQPKYPPLSEYRMSQEAEIALAKSAAPAEISDRATIEVLTDTGYRAVHQGNNGFVCMVMRGFTGAPTFTPVELRGLVFDAKTRVPICFNPQAVKTVLPYYELRTRLGMEGKSPDEIALAVRAAYARGGIPKRAGVSFAYMWSADQILGPAGHWHPHMMIYAPNYDNSMLGNNPFGSHLPVVGDDAGTPFAVVVIPVDESLAIKAPQ